MKRNLYFTILLMLVFTGSFASQHQKVLFIGIDGTKSDALQQANTPNLDQLFASGLSTYDAWCAGITISGPTWSSMMTGVWFDKHGVTNNSYTGSNFNSYPYLTTLAKQIKPELYCAEVCEWPPLIDDVYDDNFNLRLHTTDGQGPTTASIASTLLQTNDSIDFLFVYFDQVDLTGHSSGFSAGNPAYIQAIENVDSCVGAVINALHNRVNYADEDWLILVMTDHGGIGTGHGGNTTDERHIWWIADDSRGHLQNATFTGADPGSYNTYVIGTFTPQYVDTAKLRQTPVHTDIATTALHHLIYDSGIRPESQSAWQLDGKSWLKDYSPAGIAQTAFNFDVKIFPNPATDMLVIYLPNEKNEDVQAQLYDLNGRLLPNIGKNITANKINMNVQGIARGEYQLKVTEGANTVCKTVVVQ